MKIFDSQIVSLYNLLKDYKTTKLSNEKSWEVGDKNSLIFKNDIAYELGGGNLPGISGILFTSSDDVFGEDDNILIGDDMSSIKKDSPYARMMIVKVSDELLGEGNELYQNLRRIDYSRYHIEPKDLMFRISSLNQKEVLRVSKNAIKEKKSFGDLANFINNVYAEHKSVLKVKTIFINQNDFNYDHLAKIVKKSEDITKALDHLVNKVKMDCHSCSLQVVCQEVEELTEKEKNK